MTSKLTDVVIERSTYAVELTFTDEDGASVTPTGVRWSLTTGTGAVVNGRRSVAVAAAAGASTVVLSGADLALSQQDERELRILTVEALYDSDSGTGLPCNQEVWFYVTPMRTLH